MPAPVITASLFQRFASRDQDAYSNRLIAALRNQFGGHAVVTEAKEAAVVTPDDAAPVIEAVDIDDEEPVEAIAHSLDAVAPPPPLRPRRVRGLGRPGVAQAPARHRRRWPSTRRCPTASPWWAWPAPQWSDDEFRQAALDAAPCARARMEEGRGAGSATWRASTPRSRTFDRLKEVLAEADADCGTGGNRVFYLATVPAMFGAVASALGRARLQRRRAPDGSFARLVVEKPFGRDLDSARALDAALHRAFDENQIFRIDHYLGKETVQNVLALRFANAIFEPIWNRRYVDHIQITVAEELGVEHRGGFYETAGALRDIVQNHVMQVLALTLMEPPATVDAQGIRDEKVKLLQRRR